MDLKDKIAGLAEKYFPEITEIRKHLHSTPELSFQEFNTSEFIANQLTALGIPFKKGFVKTGILAKLEAKNPGKKCIAIRADMDALPVEEKNEVSYRSLNPGIMHACGHDVHMSVLLGCIRILNELKNEIEGTYLFVFQPGEEKLPGGAKLMLEEGIFKDQKPEVVLGLHVLPDLESGKLGFKAGTYMASTDEIYLKIKGKGGHGAMPQDIIDPVLIASHIVVALQQIISRRANPMIPTVLSFGKFIANGATNVIPDEANLEGTFRTLNEKWRKQAHVLLHNTATKIAQSMGGECEVKILIGYPVLNNDERLTLSSSQLASQFLGKKNVMELEMRMTAEDFAYFTQLYPSVFFRLGIMNKGKNINSALHTATFDVDMSSLQTGMGAMAYIAALLQPKKQE
jgi:amidohydrolase